MQEEWNLFLRGSSSLSSEAADTASPAWLSLTQWDQIVLLDRAVPPLAGIAESMRSPADSVDWQRWANCAQPHSRALPDAWESACTSFHRLLLLKVWLAGSSSLMIMYMLASDPP